MAKNDEPKQSTASPEDARKAAVSGVGSQTNLKAGESTMAPAVQSTTTKTPAEADKSSLPNAMDAKTNDPPVRAGEPYIPIAQTLAAGAGAHTPPDPVEFGPDGRPKGDPDTL